MSAAPLMKQGQPPQSPSRADFLIQTLGLTYLPKESGYIGLLGQSHQLVTPPYLSKPLAAQSHNYYMLTAKFPVNYIHLLSPDDTHILVEGGPVEYYIFTPPSHPVLNKHPLQSSGPPSPPPCAKAERVILGLDYLAGQRPVISIPGGCFKALRLCDGAEYALMANVLCPEFTPEGVKIGAGRMFVEMFMGEAEWAREELLTGLIGEENWAEDD